MLVIIKRDYSELSREAARIVAGAVQRKPNLVLGLATGRTPLGLYGELVRLHREGRLDFANVITFNLDEYLGLPPDHPQSCSHYMNQNLLDHLNIKPENIHIPDGTLRDNYEGYCERYEETIRKAGGIDLQILGIGKDGHIGFNEPTSSLASRTRVKTLSRQTVEDYRRFFRADEPIPQCAVTMRLARIRPI